MSPEGLPPPPPPPPRGSGSRGLPGQGMPRWGLWALLGLTLSVLFLGPLLTLVGGRYVGLMFWWRPFKTEDVATITGLIEDGKVRPDDTATTTNSQAWEMPSRMPVNRFGSVAGRMTRRAVCSHVRL